MRPLSRVRRRWAAWASVFGRYCYSADLLTAPPPPPDSNSIDGSRPAHPRPNHNVPQCGSAVDAPRCGRCWGWVGAEGCAQRNGSVAHHSGDGASASVLADRIRASPQRAWDRCGESWPAPRWLARRDPNTSAAGHLHGTAVLQKDTNRIYSTRTPFCGPSFSRRRFEPARPTPPPTRVHRVVYPRTGPRGRAENPSGCSLGPSGHRRLTGGFRPLVLGLLSVPMWLATGRGGQMAK